MACPPTVDDFKAKFTREFIYGTGLDTVTDNDITRAISEAPPIFNQSLLDTLTDQTNAYLYLVAHLLWENIDMAGGLSAVSRGRGFQGDGEGVTVAKGVGQANVNYQPPPELRISQSPTLMRLWRSKFGMRYVMMISPRLIGNMAVVPGPCGELDGVGFNPV